MRFPNSSCLLCRRNVLSKNWNTQRVAIVPSQRASSLSAIHHGLRQSEKARPQGFKQASLETARPRQHSQNPRRSRDPDWKPPTFKIKRGKKDVTDKGPQRQSRRARFNDPESGFGKRSLVYQMKHGALRQKMAELENKDGSFASTRRSRTSRQSRTSDAPSFHRAPADPLTSSDFMKDFNTSTGRVSKSIQGGGQRREPAHSRRSTNREPHAKPIAARGSFSNRRDTSIRRPPSREGREVFDNAFSPRNRRETPARIPSLNNRHKELDDDSSFGARREVPANRLEQPTRTRNIENQDGRSEREDSRVDDGPIRIHHTTAASQFLYGRSVVEAALKDSRRQLYRLYIYNGEDRRNVSQDNALEKLAHRREVQVTKVPRDGQRMMDKMSGGRPHNGCVLEASPLPQLPLKALGALSEEPAKPGFHVEVSHQSSEEAKVNGTSDFVSYQLPQGRKPFVLLLDGILDPGNLGAILRSAAFLGVNAIAITKGSSATMTAVALKASAGASEVMTLFSISSTVDFLTRSKENGWMVYAAVPSTKRSKGNSHLTVDRVETYDPLSSQPTILVVGSEGEGLTKQVRRQADYEVSIPGQAGGFLSVVDSLNVSVATGILCSAFLRKQSAGMIEIEDEPSDSADEDKSQLW
ncbi:RNA methyltransferase [Xylariaceae sp. FL1651]|nr:RNA methyltransferase [Xylariaceae sp. FL1651]